MKVYNVEIFDRDFNIIEHFEINEAKIMYDYLSYEKNTVTKTGETVSKYGDYISIFTELEKYGGIITGTDSLDIETKITYVDWMQLMDVGCIENVELLSEKTLEEYIAFCIDALYISNADTAQNIPGLEIRTTSSTEDATLSIEDCIYNLYDDVILPAFKTYGVVLNFEVDIGNKKMVITIGTIGTSPKTIEADLPNCSIEKFILKKTSKTVNKVIVLNDEDYTESLEVYRNNDDEITTVDENRIIPVEFQYTSITIGEEESFEEQAYISATGILEQSYENLIELDFEFDDTLVNPLSMIIGQVVNIIHNGIYYSSYLSGYSLDKKATLIFGNIRLELTKKLKGRG